MIWLAIIALLILGVAIPSLGRAIGRLSLRVAVLCGLGILLVWVWMRKGDDSQESPKRSTGLRIRPSQVVISNARLEDYSPWQLTARVQNRASEHTVAWVSFHITVGDCRGAALQQNGLHNPILSASTLGSCDTVGSATQRVNVDVPPGPTRDISRDFEFPNPPVFHGRMQWTYKVVEVGADSSPKRWH